MKVEELIEHLKQCKPNAVVHMCDTKKKETSCIDKVTKQGNNVFLEIV